MQNRMISLYFGIGILLAMVAAVALLTQGDSAAFALDTPAAQEDESEETAVALPTDSTFATVDLASGFILDPYLLRVMGQGDIPAEEIEADCVGFVAESPNVALNWSGETDALHLFVYSDSDPVLVVETPDGEFLCNDDANEVVLDSLVSISDPAEGTYNIHVGSFSAEEPVLGFLVVTEIDLTEDLDDLDLTPLLDRREHVDETAVLPDATLDDLALGATAVFGNDELEAEFTAVTMPAAGGGDFAVHGFDAEDRDCQGYVSLVPTYSFELSEATDVALFFEADHDSALLLVGPDGVLACSDNADDGNLNPLILLSAAAAGQYDVFVAGHVPHDIVTGQLTIAAENSASPDVLSADQETGE